MCGKQKNPKGSCPGRDRLEAEEEPEAEHVTPGQEGEEWWGLAEKHRITRKHGACI